MLAASQVIPTHTVKETVTWSIYWTAFSLDSGIIASPIVLLLGQDGTPAPAGLGVLTTATRLQTQPAELSFSSAASTLPLACTAGQSTLSLKEECSKVVDGLLWAWSMTTLLSLTQHLVVTYHSVNQHMPPVFPSLRKPHRAELPWSVCFSQIPTLLINSAASPSKQLSRVFVTWN